MKATHSVGYLRFLISLAALGLLAVFLLFPGQAQAQATPVIAGDDTVSVAENTSMSTVIATYTATDMDANTTFMWTLEGTDAAFFNITTNSSGVGDLRFNSAPNFEAERSYVYNVTVKVADNESTPMSATLPVTVTVTDVNDAPEFIKMGLTSIPLQENAVNAFAAFQATDEDEDTLIWSLEGDDADLFTLVPITTGQELKFTNPPDYENPTDHGPDNVYDVTVRVTDGGGLFATRAITVTVANGDEPGTVLIEGTLSGGSTLTASVTDIDGTPTDVTWQWARGDSATGPWEGNIIPNATSASYTTVAADVNKYLRATVFYTDPESSGETANAVTGPIGAGNSEPTFNNTPVTRSFPENSAPGVSVGDPFTATDIDVDDTLTYGLKAGSDSASFTIVPTSGQIQTKSGVTYNFENFESPMGHYTVHVTVTDSKDFAGEADTVVDDEFVVTINLTNVNEAPSVTGTSNKSEGENRAVSTPIGNYTAADPDALSTFTWTLEGDDADDFGINPQGELRLLSSPDYESPTDSDTDNDYNVTVKVTDNGGLSGTADFALTIGNVNEPGTASISGTLSGGETLTASVTDPDGSISNQTYQWKRSASAGGMFNNITSNGTSSTYVLVADDVTKYLKVTVSYTDGHGSGKSATSNATGQIGAGNSEPTFSSATATRTLPENSGAGVNVVGGTVAATDSDSGDTLTYGLQSGGDSGSFTIVPASGQIQAKSGITYNFEATKKSYTVTVNVRDSKDSAGNPNTTTDDTIVVTINLTNVNEAPVITTSATTASVPENSTAVLTFAATDVDMPTTLSWSVESGNDGGKFNINSTSGVLTFKTAPDFESPTDTAPTNSYVVTVKVTDNGSPTMLSDMHTITVNVTNVNEAPVITSPPATRSITENSTAVFTFSATDVDASGPRLTWSVESADDGAFFQIDSLRCVLSFIERAELRGQGKTRAATTSTYVTVKVHRRRFGKDDRHARRSRSPSRTSTRRP